MEKYIIRDDKKILFLNNNEILYENKKPKRKTLNEVEYNELINLCNQYQIFDKKDISKPLFDFLKKEKLIMTASKEIIESFNSPYERVETFGYYFCNKSFVSTLNKKKILFIGVGGIASEIINQLIAVGIEWFYIIDFDNVASSNLNRQFVYTTNDIGKKKIEKFKEYILSKNKRAIIKTNNTKIETKEQLTKIIEENNIDFIINSADTPPYLLKKAVVESSLETKIPCIFGGVGIFDGGYGPLLDSSSSKKQYLSEINKIITEVKYIFPCKSSFGVTNTLVSTYMAFDIIMYLMGEKKKVKSLNKTITLNF